MTNLAPYAVNEALSRGRDLPEPKPKARSEFQRDRDRIIHSTAFRRLEYKTQVFVNHEGDLFRTRLTHSIEVAQLAKTIARALRLNDDLTEAIALAHDLGHTPFGHAGQDALNECMKDYGGFEHNLQSLRTVERLEERYGAFDGLNLMYETREGILKHCSLHNARLLGDLGGRFINKQRPSLEAQICNLADEVAYNNHDVDDGLRSGLVTLEQLQEVSLFSRHVAEAKTEFPQLAGRRLIHETIRRMIDAQVTDLLAESERRIEEASPESLQDIHEAPVLIGFSAAMEAENRQLKLFLREELYRHYQVLRMTSKARRIISDLFAAFMADPRLLPPQYQTMAELPPDDPMVPDAKARAVADYIAGMTDRYSMREHKRLFAIGEI
ncbi:MAG TPA: deoxyguanosinetriphosphate triphosphohydrolase [Rhodocyclaceae bacterium]|jgi:dGTPase